MTRIVQLGTADIRDLNIIAPLSKGGLEAANVPDAVVKLGAISKNKLGAPLGVAKLDANGKLITSAYPPSIIEGVTLHGNKNVSVTQVVSFKISNYDSSTIYNVTVSAGTVLISGDTITFTAPLSAQDVTLTVNGRAVIIPVSGTPVPNTPLVTATSFGTSGSAGIQLMTGVFSVFLGGSTHKNTDWDLALDPVFNNIVLSSYDDAVNKIAIEFKPVGLNTRYFARARHRDTNDKVSNWSTSVFLDTKNNYVINTEEAILAATNRAANDYFGSSIASSSDGTRIAVGAKRKNNSTGSAYVFVRSGSTWTQEAELNRTNAFSGEFLGKNIAISGDGNRVAVGSNDIGLNGNQAGAVYVFVRSGSTWTQEALVIPNGIAAGHQFGSEVSLSGDGTRLISLAWGENAQAVYVFVRSGSTWTQEAKLQGANANEALGTSISLSGDGTRCIVGINKYVDVAYSVGAAIVFVRSGSTWTQEAKLKANILVNNAEFGISVSMSLDGSRVVIGAYFDDSDLGSAYVFVRSGSTWTQEAKLIGNNRAVTDYFGRSVSITSDGSRVLIGAYGKDVNGKTNSGQMTVFVRSGSTWTQEIILTASNSLASQYFGEAVTIAGDGSRAFAGVMFTSIGAQYTGAAYVFAAT